MAHIGFVCFFQFLSKDGLKLVTLSKNNVEARGRAPIRGNFPIITLKMFLYNNQCLYLLIIHVLIQ